MTTEVNSRYLQRAGVWTDTSNQPTTGHMVIYNTYPRMQREMIMYPEVLTNTVVPTGSINTMATLTNASNTVTTGIVMNDSVVHYNNVIATVSTFTNVTSNSIYFSNVRYDDDPRWVDYEARRKRQYERDRRVSVHKAKSAIKKALKLIDNMGFGDEVRIFIGGDEIVVDNPDSIFKFVLKRGRQSIVERTINPGYSTPYSLELLTKDDVHVANLCVYLKDTPVLDQVLAIALYIKSGDEEEVLQKANWFNPTQDEGVKQLVHDYNPKFGRKVGFKPRKLEDTSVSDIILPEGFLYANRISGAAIGTAL